tara:strand:- start:4950 stop:5681 length:732 start_codon:yes stop_codon:yes gene_type:complete
MDSLKCLNKECINLLHKYRLLQPLIKSEFKSSILSEVQIDQEIENNAINEFKSKFKITNESDLEKFLEGNGLDQKDFNDLALEELRTKKYTSNKFANKSESRFLERKNQLDVVIYSLIRVTDLSLIRELYLKISEKEAGFGEIASKYSEGIERRTRGIVGPISLEKTHPALAEHLRVSKIGEVSQPIKINNSYLITRVESYEPAQLDSFMQDKMCEELFEGWLNSQSLSILKEIITKPKSNNE